MSGKRPRVDRIKSGFTFGSGLGEYDNLLASAYYDNGDYEVIESRVDRRFFLIGRTGSGKSAAFRKLGDDHPGRVVRINPEDLAMRYLTNNNVIQFLRELDVKLEPFFRALWKHVIVIEIIRYRVRPFRVDQQLGMLAQIKERLDRDPAKRRARRYFDEYEDAFWCETHERIREVVSKLEQNVTASADIAAKLGPVSSGISGSRASTLSEEERIELRNTLQEIVDQSQLLHLNDMIVTINDNLLDSEQLYTYLVIDDLDKDWVDESLANTLIRCLFDAVLDIQSIKNLKILVALRTNIFRQLGYGSVTRGGQEEKFRLSAHEIRWTRSDLYGLVGQRAAAAAVANGYQAMGQLSTLLPRKHPHRGEALDYILERSMMRPRDVITYLNLCIREAAGRPSITWDHIYAAEPRYSEDRLYALRDEWKDPYEGIDKVFEQFYGCDALLSRNDFTKILDAVTAIPARYPSIGEKWMDDLTRSFLEDGDTVQSWFDLYGSLLGLLYDISFVGISDSADSVPIYAHEEAPQPKLSEVDDDTWFHVHPAFRAHLELRIKHEVNGRAQESVAGKRSGGARARRSASRLS